LNVKGSGGRHRYASPLLTLIGLRWTFLWPYVEEVFRKKTPEVKRRGGARRRISLLTGKEAAVFGIKGNLVR